jgi:hypothetical protein
MSDSEVKFECIRLAINWARDFGSCDMGEILKKAGEIYNFVMDLK